LISFAVGSLIGDVFLHIIPHLIEASHKSSGHDNYHQHDHHDHHGHDHHGHDHDHGKSEMPTHMHDWASYKVWFMILFGIIAFFFFDKFIQMLSQKEVVKPTDGEGTELEHKEGHSH